MIHKIVTGRLGNQMFQYATVRAFQEKYNKNEIINLNFDRVRKDGAAKDGFCNQLTCFKLNNNVMFDKQIKINLIQKILTTIYFLSYKTIKLFYSKEKYLYAKRAYEEFIQVFFNRLGLYFFSNGYTEFKKCNMKNKLFIGFFESNKYFDNIKEILKKEFTPKFPEKEENKLLYDVIRNTNSICVSIRRGDFLDDKYKKKHFICDEEYFYKAIQEINNRVDNPQFVIFSDDIKWVKENMNFPVNTVFETGNDEVWEKLRLMYSCKHYIISNSTFSWWAQYLSSNNKDKVVIAPKKWLNDGIQPELYDKKWIIVE